MFILALLLAAAVPAAVPAQSPHRKAPFLQEPASRIISGLGIQLHYLDWGGSGEALVLVPGGCETGYVFGDIAPALTDRFRVLSLTQRGCGSSGRPTDGYDLDTQLREMAGFLDALSIKAATFAGHSSGGGKITRLARLYPSRVSRLVYFDTVYSFIAPGIEEKMGAAIIKQIGGSPEESFEMFAKYNQVWELGAWSSWMDRNLRETMAVDGTGKLKSVSAPAWFSAFRADMEAGRYFEENQARMGGASFGDVVDKVLDLLREEKFNAAMKEYLARLRERSNVFVVR